jgi:hypothetical protein
MAVPSLLGVSVIEGSFTQRPGHSDYAYFGGPTAVYGHAIMGRVPEATILAFGVSADPDKTEQFCEAVTGYVVDVGSGHVFEDIAPRLVDLDGDDLPEVIAVRSSFTQGAQLAVFGLRDGAFQQVGGTPYIGTRYRWLAPAAWEDLDGDGHVEIAYVDRPHLAKTLRVWRWRNGALEQVTSLRGVTNHAIGEETIQGYTRNCDRGPEMVLQSADRSRLVGLTLRHNTLSTRDLGPASQMEARRRC